VNEDLVWTRRDAESEPAYKAFRLYLEMGNDRTLPRVCETLGKSHTLITDWSAKHHWVNRVKAFDRYVIEAKTDGLVHQVAACRDANIALMDKLRGLLNDRLDEFITKRQDPTIRWTQALTAMAKVEANAFLLKDDQKTTAQMDRVEELMERLERVGLE
jgi:hypothetical protein